LVWPMVGLMCTPGRKFPAFFDTNSHLGYNKQRRRLLARRVMLAA
jgi:hypothetical protein